MLSDHEGGILGLQSHQELLAMQDEVVSELGQQDGRVLRGPGL